MKQNVPTGLPLCPGGMMVSSSVQQDPRAPADRWHRTATFQPLEGALTSCAAKFQQAVVSRLSAYSLLFPPPGLPGGEIILHCLPAYLTHLDQ